MIIMIYIILLEIEDWSGLSNAKNPFDNDIKRVFRIY